MSQIKPIRAVALISGGLDSMLAARLIQEQGIEVEGLNFYTGFCHSGHTSAIRKRSDSKIKRNDALWVAQQLKMKLHIIDIVEEYKSIVINPKYDYGKHLNPCLDCKIFMLKRAYDWMLAHEFDFIITGEVIGQRPKSQNKRYLPIVSKESGVQDRLLRPLCAQLLPETLPERLGWVDREKLKNFSGRSRRGQLDLVNDYGITDFAQPAGGCCVLTDKSYARKLRDHWAAKGERDYELADVILLKIGRHLRLSPTLKIILGREAGENQFLKTYRDRFIWMAVADFDGPLVLVDGQANTADLNLIARITARYSQARCEDSVDVNIVFPQSDQMIQRVTVAPLAEQDILESWYV